MRIVPIAAPEKASLSPDIVWDGLIGDLSLSPLDDPKSPGDLRREQHLATAALIQLQTDVRVDETELPAGVENRGWPGDSFDLEPGEVPLGSKLWLLKNSALTPDIEIRARDYAIEALQPFVDQGVVTRWDVVAEARRAEGCLYLGISGYAQSEGRIFDEQYKILWDQLNGIQSPLAE